MKTTIIILLSSIFYISFQNEAQEENVVHLSFNVKSNEIEVRKYSDPAGELSFYIGNEHFVAKGEPIHLNLEGFNKDNLIQIKELVELTDNQRRNEIEKGETSGVIRILNKDEFFDQIYLYEEKEGEILKYKVEWVEEIID